MAQDIRYAGLDERLRRRLMQATNLIYSSYAKVTTAPWDGSACDLVVADPDQSQGASAIAAAQQQGVTVITIARDAAPQGDASVPPTVTAASLTEVVSGALTGSPMKAVKQSAALVRLASERNLAGRDVDALRRGRCLGLRPSAGRAYAYSQSELRALAGELSEADWSFEPTGTIRFGENGLLASMSLECLYLLAADACKGALPWLPNDNYTIRRQPELSDADALAYPVTVADVLDGRSVTPGAIALETGLSPTDANACLWAFQAAGVTRVLRDRTADAERGGLFNQLLGHFRRDRGGAVAR